jgi:hypothetical protein
MTEGDVPVFRAPDVESAGVRELTRIAIRRKDMEGTRIAAKSVMRVTLHF